MSTYSEYQSTWPCDIPIRVYDINDCSLTVSRHLAIPSPPGSAPPSSPTFNARHSVELKMTMELLSSLKEELLEALALPITIKSTVEGTVLYQNAAAAAAAATTTTTTTSSSSSSDNTATTTTTFAATTTIPLHDATGTVVATAECGNTYPRVAANTTTTTTTTAASSSSSFPRTPSGNSLAGVHEQEDDGDRHTGGGMISYRTLFQHMQTGALLGEVIVHNNDDNTGTSTPIDFRILDINPAFAALTGISFEQIGQRITTVLPGIEDDPIQWIQHFGAVALGGEPHTFRNQHSTTLQRWLGGVAYNPRCAGDNNNNTFVTLLMDVSDHVQAEEAIRESEERHRNLFESMMQGVVYQSAQDGAIIAANPSAERVLGLTLDQMMGRTSVDPRWKSVHEDGSDFPGETHPSMVALRTGQPEVGVVMGVFHPTDQKTHWILIDAIPRFRPGDSKPYQVYTTFTDLTETKEFERKLVLAKERAEMADRLKSSFLANMSHEIRTPLNGIIGNIDLALSNELSEDSRQDNLEGLLVAKESGSLLLSIIQDVLDLSKIEAGQMDVKSDEVFSLLNIVHQTTRLGQTIIQQRGKTKIELVQHIATDITDSICGDPFRLQQVLNNLVSNAIKFTDEGKVQVSVTRSNEQQQQQQQQLLQICVSDTGKGIPADHLESIFDSFRQVEIGDTRNHGGTGLGLTISRKLAELMGGNLSVVSSVDGPDKGSRFTVVLPYKPMSKLQATTELSSSSQSTREVSTGSINSDHGNNTILVAEDETVSRRLVKRMLEVSGYNVLLAEDGSQAVEMFKNHTNNISLILMDVQMPHLDGLAATELIRALEEGRKEHIPIIALSAGAMKGDHEQGLAVGMTDYLTKPVNFKLLKETLKKYLG